MGLTFVPPLINHVVTHTNRIAGSSSRLPRSTEGKSSRKPEGAIQADGEAKAKSCPDRMGRAAVRLVCQTGHATAEAGERMGPESGMKRLTAVGPKSIGPGIHSLIPRYCRKD